MSHWCIGTFLLNDSLPSSIHSFCFSWASAHMLLPFLALSLAQLHFFFQRIVPTPKHDLFLSSLTIPLFCLSYLHVSLAVRTILVAIIAFFPTKGAGAIGALECPAEDRKNLARHSGAWKCPKCAQTNAEILPRSGTASGKPTPSSTPGKPTCCLVSCDPSVLRFVSQSIPLAHDSFLENLPVFFFSFHLFILSFEAECWQYPTHYSNKVVSYRSFLFSPLFACFQWGNILSSATTVRVVFNGVFRETTCMWVDVSVAFVYVGWMDFVFHGSCHFGFLCFFVSPFIVELSRLLRSVVCIAALCCDVSNSNRVCGVMLGLPDCLFSQLSSAAVVVIRFILRLYFFWCHGTTHGIQSSFSCMFVFSW